MTIKTPDIVRLFQYTAGSDKTSRRCAPAFCKAALLKFVEQAEAEPLRNGQADDATHEPKTGGKICWCRRAAPSWIDICMF
jgi:hypothetical protein